jgi:hypothetical protein
VPSRSAGRIQQGVILRVVNEREIAVDVACHYGVSRLGDLSYELSDVGFGDELWHRWSIFSSSVASRAKIK